MKKRTRIISALLFSLAFVGMFSAKAQDDVEVLNLDLQTALSIAQDNNPTIKIAEMELLKKGSHGLAFA